MWRSTFPTQMGYDSDHRLAVGEVGRVGVAIDSIEDMAELFGGIPLDRVSTSMPINATAIILLAMYVAVARRQGVPLRSISGTTQNDILKEYVARGTYIYPPQGVPPDRHRYLRVLRARAAQLAPHLHQRVTHSRGWRHGGAGSRLHVRQRDRPTCRRRSTLGSMSMPWGQRLSFFFAAHNNFLEEIAKFRAARRLWARLMRDRFRATVPRAQQLRFHTQTAGSTLTAQQPDNNIVRVALQALAAVLGGTQSLHCNGRDEALGLPTEASAQLALRTQQIMVAETGVTNTVDPVGGAYAIERLTDDIERDALDLIRENRRARRNPARHRSGNHPARDSGCRLPGAAGGRPRREDRRRGEPLRHRSRGTHRRAADRPHHRAAAARSGPGATRRS